MWIDILKAFLAMGILGLILGALLGLAGNLFAVKEDKRKQNIVDLLPGANCGACGFAGCASFADAILNKNASCGQCPSVQEEKLKGILSIVGSDMLEAEKKVAHIRCHGSNEFANNKYVYYGMNDCAAAGRLLGGYMTCQYGCLGFGNCLKKCPNQAISIQNGVAVVDRELCSGCGVCIEACPKGVIELIPADSGVLVDCSNNDKGGRTREACNIGCIGCGLCEKNCPTHAIKVDGNVALIDYSMCIRCGVCAENCPRKIIRISEVKDEQ